jgi:hypothetical protein
LCFTSPARKSVTIPNFASAGPVLGIVRQAMVLPGAVHDQLNSPKDTVMAAPGENDCASDTRHALANRCAHTFGPGLGTVLSRDRF